MKNVFKILFILSLAMYLSACKEGSTASQSGQDTRVKTGTVKLAQKEEIDLASFQQSLDEIAELERAGTWLTGMALTESGIRENAGDFTGAVAAAYKELSFAYGRGFLKRIEVENGLSNLLSLNSKDEVSSAANAMIAFSREQWDTAAAELNRLFGTGEQSEPDSFTSWMTLVCALEKDKNNRRASEAYKAIRARYSQFPEYWYRGARAFSGNIAAEYAENCINSAIEGPFANECRKIISANAGIKTEDGLSIRTKKEIESIISQSINTSNPEILEPLFPLIALPDNPYTMYAVGALRALMNIPVYKDYLLAKAESSRGRLAERLTYISRS